MVGVYSLNVIASHSIPQNSMSGELTCEKKVERRFSLPPSLKNFQHSTKPSIHVQLILLVHRRASQLVKSGFWMKLATILMMYAIITKTITKNAKHE